MADADVSSRFERILEGIFLLPFLLYGLLEAAYYIMSGTNYRGEIPELFVTLYPAREWIHENWILCLVVLLVLIVPYILLARKIYWVINNKILTRMYGEKAPEKSGFKFDYRSLEDELQVDPSSPKYRGVVCVGRDVKTRKAEWVSYEQRTMHFHVLGSTGSGKTRGVLMPMIYQDMVRKKGMLIIDAKGDREFVDGLKGLARTAGRLEELKMFSLPFPDESHTYNPIHPIPETSPQTMAEMLLSCFEFSDEYYASEAKTMLKSTFTVLAATEIDGKNVPFTIRDVLVFLSSEKCRNFFLERTSDKRSAHKIRSKIQQLGDRFGQTYTGLISNLEELDIDQLNSSDPDIVISDIVSSGGIVYFQLPAVNFKILAPAIGKLVLQNFQQCAGLRDMGVLPKADLFCLYADEFYTFAYEGFSDAVNKLRSAKVPILLAHQTVADLEGVSKEFADRIWGNTRLKLIMAQEDADLAERVARTIGTQLGLKRTARHTAGKLWTTKPTFDYSEREVEEFILHPNQIKALHTWGQAYFLKVKDDPDDDSPPYQALNLALLPERFYEGGSEISLPKKSFSKGFDFFRRFVEGGEFEVRSERDLDEDEED